ncbi:TPA: hypothetical protein ACFOVJ_000384 [Neisseria meningitidis]|uniref:hypothetical protein n=1 Tax=Neisseria meningitidis TaxID=487 RepID=UPI00030C58A3|nr:hypothetical protein [Neisseria meningitidis]MBG8685667.1 hypothetical protein [Neisseria meningitidis]MBG8753726.1 hypothetical protein [Neisseria meningitidis]MBG8783089.1 hypothetical protein [Neisseria meningitidis]MBG8810514.1 hypothetical protein [Neisseria meningitidis]MBG8812766.1 hypothetical protein [Neisseria meningitidis]
MVGTLNRCRLKGFCFTTAWFDRAGRVFPQSAEIRLIPYGHPAAPFSDGIYSGLTKIRTRRRSRRQYK